MFNTAIVSLALLFSTPAFSATSSEFRGYFSVNQILRERLFLPGTEFELGRYVAQSYSTLGGSLLDLLGTYKSSGGKFNNGIPNALNMLLWHVLLSGLSADVGKICTREPTLDFTPTFVNSVLPLCNWPNGIARGEAVLLNFWLTVMSYDAPLTEYGEWKAFLADPEASFQGAEAVEWITLSVLNNRYLLLKQ